MTVHVTPSAGVAGSSVVAQVPSSGFTTAHTKTSWVQLLASAPASNRLLVRVICETSTPTWAIDIGFGGSGSETVIVPNLMTAPTANGVQVYDLPLHIPEGTRISVRAQSSSATVRCWVQILCVYDSRFSIGSAPTAYTAYNITVDGSNTAVTSAVASDTTANTKGSTLTVVSSVPSGATVLVLGSERGGDGANNRHLVDIRVSDDGSSWSDLIANIGFTTLASTFLSDSIMALPISGVDGKYLGLRMQSSVVATSSNREKRFPIYIGTGAVEGTAGTLIQEAMDMQRIVKNTATASLRTLRFFLRAESGVPYAGSTTGKKAKFKINGTGTEYTTNADVAMADSETAKCLVTLTQAESDLAAVGDTIDAYIPASAGNHLTAEATAMVFEEDFTGAAPSDSAIADAVVAAELTAIGTLVRSGAGTSGTIELGGTTFNFTATSAGVLLTLREA